MGVYNGTVWLPDSPEEVQDRFSTSKDQTYVYLYEVTNLDDIRRGSFGSDIPVMKRIGPYVFQKKRKRTQVEWSDDGDSVGFLQRDEYTFVESESIGNLTDTVVTLNIPLVGVVEMILSRYSSHEVTTMMQWVAQAVERWGDKGVSGIFMTRRVEDLLFGYTDPVLSLISRFVPGVTANFSLLSQGRQESMVMKTGRHDVDGIGEIIMWHDAKDIMAWAKPEPIHGTDGRQFSPSIRETLGTVVDVYNETRHVWVAEAFRSIAMVPSRQVDCNKSGLELVRLLPAERAFQASPTYYQKYDGLFNISYPVNAGIAGAKSPAGPRLFLSLPGFCHVDPAVSRTVKGVSCATDKKDPHIFLDVEPTTGVTVKARKALMLSSWYGKIYNVLEPRIDNEAYLPVIEVVETSSADTRALLQLKRLQRGVAMSTMLLEHSHFWSTLFLLLGMSIAVPLCIRPQRRVAQRTSDMEESLLA